MESQPQNPEFSNNPENFHPCILTVITLSHIHEPVSWIGYLALRHNLSQVL